MKLTRTGVQIIEETEYGVYMWQMPDGRYLSMGEGRVLNVPARKGDLEAIAAISREAKSFGEQYAEGSPVFQAGAYRIDDSDAEEQLNDMKEGRLPDVKIRR